MHIESNIDPNKIKRCFSDLHELQKEISDRRGKPFNIQITEFDMCLSESELFDENGNAISLDTKEKEDKMKIIERIIQESGVQLEGISYWTATDTLSPDVQRTNTKTFIAKDFYAKFKSLKEGKLELKEVLQHPLLVNLAKTHKKLEELRTKFREMYESKDERLELYVDEKTKERQRDVILSRGSGLYSEITREKEGITLQEIGKGTTKSFSQNPDRAEQVIDSVEKAVNTKEETKEVHTQEECLE